MEAGEVNSDTVHPEVRAHINSLVSALGGFGDDGYKLGDDALECLRDLKRWIRFYDEKTNRMDVARCLAESNLVGNDLLHILATWTQNCADTKFRARIALACFEIIVPLTWVIEKDKDAMTVNHHRHMPVLQLAQLGYKRAIINFDGAPILNTAVRVALPSMAMPIGERTARDNGIIKLVLFFIRNMAVIVPPPDIKYEGDESQISRSATIDAFSYQDIFATLLMISSNMGEDFRNEDTVVMEIIFHLVKRVDSSKLFVTQKDLHKAKADELSAAMSKEAAMLRSHNKNAPTRHSRFGTMIWVKRDNGKMATVTGQDALMDAATRERKMDNSKVFRAPRKVKKEDQEFKDLGPPASLDERARQQLRSFVDEFLDSGFNPLFASVIHSIHRESPNCLHTHRFQFFYLVAWFLEAERMRRKSRQGQKPSPADDEVGSFNLVAEVLSQHMFIMLNRQLDRAYSDKDWPLLSAIMRCLTQILLTVQEMSESANEDDQDIADNILNRLFYEETTHDAIANVIRTYKDQGFEYLDASTELTYTFLRILEAYSKQNVDMQVRSRKRTRRKKKAAKAAGEQPDDGVEEDVDESADDEQNAEKTSQERKFDFTRFAARFVSQAAVDTFVTFTKFYRDLDDYQLKRAHRYFHRVAFKQDQSVVLFRLDVIHLFYNMIKGPEPLDKSSTVFKEWEELAKQIIKKCVRKLEERPVLFTELLFSKINSTAHYLEYGYEKQIITHPRPAAELEFKRVVERDEQIAIVVGVLLDKNHSDHLEWIKQQLAAAVSERRARENFEKALAIAAVPDGTVANEAGDEAASKPAPSTTIRPDTDARRTAMFKNPHLRLLMTRVGIERLAPTLDETPDSIWVFPGSLTSDALKESLDLINKAEFSPPVFEAGELAEDQLKRKSAPRKRATYDDDDDDGNEGIDGLIDDDGETLFPMGGPTARKSTAEDGARPKKRSRRRQGSQEPETVPDEELEARARARRQKQLEKVRRVKSDMYVHASDDDSDDENYKKRSREFLAAEALRQQIKDSTFGLSSRPNNADKSEWDMLLDVESGGDESSAGVGELGGSAKRKRDGRGGGSASSEEDEESSEDGAVASDGSEASSVPPSRLQKKRKLLAARKDVVEISDEEEDGDGVMGVTRASSRTVDAEMESNDGPMSSSAASLGQGGTTADLLGGDAQSEDEDEDEDEEDVPAPRVRARARVMAGFMVDSSDEE
ncbi:timeless protein-domain-containing protein [Podospora appendiculata]|uniref:Topoisomerase 1-associated factor 1 n=1 Tax=Podospora appendiculata TaxID=314037 RepID=A0AAE1C9R1_9PEZI|nr:timeless protein-domain-containing protein [Podospora appendiculata]